MRFRPKHWLLPFFSLNKSEQRGIVVLSIIVLLLLFFNMLMPFIIKPESPVDLKQFEQEIIAFQLTQQKNADSIRLQSLQNSGHLDLEMARLKIKPLPFDPNKYPEEAWIAMGFTSKQAKKIKNYEAQGGKFYRKEDVLKLYCISEVEYQILEPYIQIKTAYKTKPAKKKYKEKNKKPIALQSININTADATLVQKNLQLNKWLAQRIINYRKLLGGYVKHDQLQEVYGMKPSQLKKILPYVSIDTTKVIKLDINKITFKALLKHPYVDYQVTKVIINARKKNGPFGSINELQNLPAISDTAFFKIAPYLQITPQ